MVTLLGPGGVGKTRLATAVAETMAPAFDNQGGFAAFNTALHHAAVGSALVAVLLAVLAVAALRHVPPTAAAPATDTDPHDTTEAAETLSPSGDHTGARR
jgi:hypothetical protein